MNEIYNIPTDSDIMDVARMWYLRLEEDAGNDQVLAQFDTWADADPVHRDAFNAVVDFWSHIDNMPEIIEMRETGTSFPERNDPPTTQENIVAISSVRKMAGMGEKWHKWSIAAMVLITFGFAISLYVNYLPPGTYRTATGEQRTVQLADGSTVYLNTHSKIKVDFSGDIRKIHLLQGEARFDVAKDKNRPFIVETSRGNIRAVGTSFNVYDSAEMVEVLVFEGTVEVSNKKRMRGNILKPILVTDGERIAVFDNNMGVVRTANDLELSQKNAWRNGKLIFRGQKLSDVIQEISRYTNKKIIITDDSLNDMKLGGAFDINDLDALFHAIEDTFPVRIIHFTPFVTVIVEA